MSLSTFNIVYNETRYSSADIEALAARLCEEADKLWPNSSPRQLKVRVCNYKKMSEGKSGKEQNIGAVQVKESHKRFATHLSFLPPQEIFEELEYLAMAGNATGVFLLPENSRKALCNRLRDMLGINLRAGWSTHWMSANLSWQQQNAKAALWAASVSSDVQVRILGGSPDVKKYDPAQVVANLLESRTRHMGYLSRSSVFLSVAAKERSERRMYIEETIDQKLHSKGVSPLPPPTQTTSEFLRRLAQDYENKGD